MRRGALWAGLVSLLAITSGTSWAYRDYFTPEQREQLAKVQTVLVEAIALTDKGSIDSNQLREVATRRLSELGYTVVIDPAKPHDVVFRVKCEQRKVWKAPRRWGAT